MTTYWQSLTMFMSPTAQAWRENPFETREDVVGAGVALLASLEPYKSPLSARIRIPTGTGTGFSEQAAQLEGFARPLWLVPHLMATSPESIDKGSLDLESWIRGLKAGTDPASAEYWGGVGDFDQRMVEMESIAYSLLVSPDAFRLRDDAAAAERLVAWLRQINDRAMPRNNWRWFRVLVNLALTRTLGVEPDEVRQTIDEDLALLDEFYLGHGWASDGHWGGDRRQADYYSGSFAIQFAQLLYVRLAPDFDPERTQRYREQAAEFGANYWRFFHRDGASIPFGRSLTYRFAMAAFWGAAAAAGVRFPWPLDRPGVVKGLLLRHLRWWAKQSAMFNADGTLSIGYTYPNMYMSEDYNSPQSVYWCLKPFVVLALPGEDAFWQTPEEDHPSVLYGDLPAYHLLEEPRQILCNTPEHHFLLSSGQDTQMNHKGREAKYGKLAYSSAFAFSVPVGTMITQMAPDSTLTLGYDGGQGWQVHWSPGSLGIARVKVQGQKGETEVTALTSAWQPWGQFGPHVRVRTTLVPPVPDHPGWHLRMHTVTKTEISGSTWYRNLTCNDHGFSASAQTSEGACIHEMPYIHSLDDVSPSQQGWWGSDARGALVLSETGASGVMDLTATFLPEEEVKRKKDDAISSTGGVMKPAANTNLMMPRTLIPGINHSVILQSEAAAEFTFVTGIFAVEEAGGKSRSEMLDMWWNPPRGMTIVDV